MAKKFSAGRGLNALITMDDLLTGGSSSINEVELAKITPNPDQPRQVFDDEALEELATSIRSLGIIQPITLREVAPESYQIISGERRYRASLLAGLETVPAYVKTADDDNVMEMALIENIQREDLNAIEISLAYQKMIDAYGLTQEQLSERIGKKRATIANYLRLLKLPAEIQLALKSHSIDMGHARALISIPDAQQQLQVFGLIQQKGLSVRQVEELVRQAKAGTLLPSGASPKRANDYQLLNAHLTKFFSTRVKISSSVSGKGKISIPFADEAELERIVTLLDRIK